MKKKRVINRYFGRLTAAQIAEGMNVAKRNAERLLNDATLLADASRFPTACALAILSIEEAGKLSLLRMMATAKDDAALKEAWKAYRDHQAKNAPWIIADLVQDGARTLADLKPIYDKNSDHTAVLDTVKQLGFYSDCFGQAHWSEPDTVVDEKLTKAMLFIARVLLPKKETSEREIELWIENDPSAGSDLFEFYKALVAEGLSDLSLKEVERFLA